MKYIVFGKKIEDVNHEVPVIFPDNCVHAHVAQVLVHTPELHSYKPVSAGFVQLPMTVMGRSFPLNCHGESETLGGLKSRGEIDEKLITWYEYTKGMEGAYVPGIG